MPQIRLIGPSIFFYNNPLECLLLNQMAKEPAEIMETRETIINKATTTKEKVEEVDIEETEAT